MDPAAELAARVLDLALEGDDALAPSSKKEHVPLWVAPEFSTTVCVAPCFI